MQKPRPKRLRSILDASGTTAALMRKAQRHEDTTERIRRLLPREVAGHLLSAAIDGRRLLLATRSPVWTSRLRFMVPSLKAAVTEIDEVRIRTAPPSARPTADAPARRARRISARNAEYIELVAGTVRDEALKRALLRLAAHRAGADPRDPPAR